MNNKTNNINYAINHRPINFIGIFIFIDRKHTLYNTGKINIDCCQVKAHSLSFLLTNNMKLWIMDHGIYKHQSLSLDVSFIFVKYDQ